MAFKRNVITPVLRSVAPARPFTPSQPPPFSMMQTAVARAGREEQP